MIFAQIAPAGSGPLFAAKSRGLQFMLESGIAAAGLMAGCLAG
jgi:hypothetical protein